MAFHTLTFIANIQKTVEYNLVNTIPLIQSDESNFRIWKKELENQ
ncbi:hypothetical protein CLU82_0039 [Flavobacterium sp. 5]|nr:hypothetical protein CLU82_0039 [Flavobacterium sp. 5]